MRFQNPLLAASNANGRNDVDEDKLSDYVPNSRDISVSRAVSEGDHLVFCVPPFRKTFGLSSEGVC